MAIGASYDQLATDFGITASAIGLLASSYYYLYTAMQIPTGIILDTVGPRWAVGLSGLLAAIGAFMFALAPNFEVALAGRLLLGMCLAFIFVGVMKFNSVWFPPERYGAISGFTLFIGNLGAILATQPLTLMLEIASWRDVFLGVAILGGIMAVLSLIFLRNHPADVGFATLPTKASQNWRQALLATLLNRRLLPAFFVQAGTAGSVFAFAGLGGIPLMVDVFSLEKFDATYYVTLLMLGLAIGSLSSGVISDRVGKRKPFIVGFSSLAMLSWAIMLAGGLSTGAAGYILFFLLGFAAGGAAVIYAMAREVANPLFAGMTIAWVNMGLFFGAAVSQYCFGLLLELQWDGTEIDSRPVYSWANYQLGLWLSLGFAIVGCLAALFTTETNCRNQSNY